MRKLPELNHVPLLKRAIADAHYKAQTGDLAGSMRMMRLIPLAYGRNPLRAPTVRP